MTRCTIWLTATAGPVYSEGTAVHPVNVLTSATAERKAAALRSLRIHAYPLQQGIDLAFSDLGDIRGRENPRKCCLNRTPATHLTFRRRMVTAASPRSKMSCRIKTLWPIRSSSRRVVAGAMCTAIRRPDGLGLAAIPAGCFAAGGPSETRVLRPARPTSGGSPVAACTAHAAWVGRWRDPPSMENPARPRGHLPTPRDAQCAAQHAAMGAGCRERRDPPHPKPRAPCDLGV